MKEFFKNNRKDIVIGVIVSIITAVIIKGADWIAKAAPAVGFSITNLIYYSAASMTDTLLVGILLASVLAIYIAHMASGLDKGFYSLKRLLTRINEEELGDNNTAQCPVNEEDERAEIRANIKKCKRLGWLLIIILVLLICIFSVFVVYPAGLSVQFDRDIVQIHPYVEDSDMVQLESEWVSMRTKADYDEIYEFIDNVRVENNLPKL